jgi:Ca2+/H+ antiporter
VGKLFGVYLLNACPAMLPIIYSWNSANTSGYTKRVMRNGLTLIAFCVGNLIGPQLFPASDGPLYRSASIALIAIMAAVCVFALILRRVVVWQNTQKDKEGSRMDESDRDLAFSDLTDMQNTSFRYVY